MSDGIDHLSNRIDRDVDHAQQLAVNAMQTLTKQAGDMRDQTARRVQADPMKAVLVAAAAGAATALLLQWVTRGRPTR